MSTHSLKQTPQSKKEFMVVENMANEVLVYDTTKNKLHVLSPVAAEVWNSCDGQTSIAEIAGKINLQADAQTSESVTCLALTELEKSGLLQGSLKLTEDQMSRRAMFQKAAVIAGIALPIVTTLIAPAPARAQSAAPPAGGDMGLMLGVGMGMSSMG